MQLVIETGTSLPVSSEVDPAVIETGTSLAGAHGQRNAGKRELSMSRTLDDAVAQLQRDPRHPVRATVGELTLEVRVVSGPPATCSAAEAFATIGPWAGETTEEVLALLEAARLGGGQRSVPEL